MAEEPQAEPRIGVDVGGVLMGRVRHGAADTAFLHGGLEKAMETPPDPGAFDGLKTLIQLFDGRVWIVSRASEWTQNKTRLWLGHWNFYEATGLPSSQIHFCLHRHEKAAHAKQLRLTHFVDDRLEVLAYLREVVQNLFLFGEQPKLRAFPDFVTPVIDWPTATDTIAVTLGRK